LRAKIISEISLGKSGVDPKTPRRPGSGPAPCWPSAKLKCSSITRPWCCGCRAHLDWRLPDLTRSPCAIV